MVPMKLHIYKVFLYNWAFNPDFVEVYIVTFADGSYAVVHGSNNKAYWAELPYVNHGSYITLPGDSRQITSVGHTHGYGGQGSTASDADKNLNLPGVTSRYIFYDGSQHYY